MYESVLLNENRDYDIVEETLGMSAEKILIIEYIHQHNCVYSRCGESKFLSCEQLLRASTNTRPIQ